MMYHIVGLGHPITPSKMYCVSLSSLIEEEEIGLRCDTLFPSALVEINFPLSLSLSPLL